MKNLGSYLKIIILTLIFISCEESTEIEPIKGLIADAGEDITIPASSYVVFDASGSYLGENPNPYKLWLEWIQDENNPEEVSLFSGDNLTRVVGFIKEGTYTFKLVINNGTDTSNTDEKVVIVLPREKSIIEDPYLETHIRYLLKKQEGMISKEDLINLDSLVNYHVPLGTHTIENISGIENCINLKHINLNLESISNISSLKNLVQLNFLSINQNEILSDISPLASLVNLEFLDIETNDISDIGMLGALKKLKSFNIMYNEKIDDINVVENFLELERLLLGHQNIENINCVKNLEHLRDLFAPKCNINDITPLENLANLDWLFLIYNNITDISPLRNLTKLRKLFLSTNNINSIEILEFLPNLQTISLVDNKIEDILPLVRNINLNKGDDVYLMDNPLSEKSINEYIPELQKRGVLVFW